jgi:hypothetical protein
MSSVKQLTKRLQLVFKKDVPPNINNAGVGIFSNHCTSISMPLTPEEFNEGVLHFPIEKWFCFEYSRGVATIYREDFEILDRDFGNREEFPNHSEIVRLNFKPLELLEYLSLIDGLYIYYEIFPSVYRVSVRTDNLVLAFSNHYIGNNIPVLPEEKMVSYDVRTNLLYICVPICKIRYVTEWLKCCIRDGEREPRDVMWRLSRHYLPPLTYQHRRMDCNLEIPSRLEELEKAMKRDPLYKDIRRSCMKIKFANKNKRCEYIGRKLYEVLWRRVYIPLIFEQIKECKFFVESLINIITDYI